MKTISFRFKLVIVLLWALPQISTDIYLPSMPDMAVYFHSSLDLVQYTIFFYTMGFSCGALFFGPISDRIGRRPVILWSLGLATAGSLLAICSTSLLLLNIARFIQGVALVGVGSTMRAVTKDICPDKEEMARFGAILGIVIPLAASIAPVIGGYIQKYSNWRFSFVFLLIYILIFLTYSLKHLPETNHTRLERPLKYLIVDYQEVLANAAFLRYNAISAFAMCAMFAYVTVSSNLLQVKVGLSPEAFGYSNLLISATLILSSFINSKLIARRGIDQMLQRGCQYLALSGSIFLICGVLDLVNFYTVIIPLAILVFGCGFIYPNASAGSLSLFSKSAGTAGAIYAFVQMIGGSAGSGLISLMSNRGNAQSSLGIIVIVLGLIGTKLCSQLKKRNQQLNNPARQTAAYVIIQSEIPAKNT